MVPLSTGQEPLTSSLTECPPLKPLSQSSNDDSDPAEKQAFEDWLIRRWQRKDELMSRYFRDGDFVNGDSSTRTRSGQGVKYLQFPLRPPSVRQEIIRFLLVPLGLTLAYGYYRIGHLLVSSLVSLA